MKKITVLNAALIFCAMFAPIIYGQSLSKQNERILIYDGAQDSRSLVMSRFEAIQSLVKNSSQPNLSEEIKSPKSKKSNEIVAARKKILAKSPQIKKIGLELMKSIESMKDSVNCQEFRGDEIISSVAGGSFTKPNAAQKAFLYKLYFCDDAPTPQETYADPIGGILIVENGKTVANYVYAGFRFSEIKSLPDINRNNLSEIILARDYNEIEIAEIIKNNLKTYGNFTEIHSYNGGLDGIPYTYLSRKIYAVPGKNPEFFQQSFFRSGADEWKQANSLKKISLKSSRDWSNLFRLVK